MRASMRVSDMDFVLALLPAGRGAGETLERCVLVASNMDVLAIEAPWKRHSITVDGFNMKLCDKLLVTYQELRECSVWYHTNKFGFPDTPFHPSTSLESGHGQCNPIVSKTRNLLPLGNPH
ncbi:hypothetical protein M431DRAFT_344768 [Trichoderma harzianum CBS 226.95]|uniref:Uncharacterized protein n=1 Tax=Trichoderma harzianum CBS 226.95 TaxID=983964 RepID=A0A2T4AKL7_TRIHA|nr:hypothetical protein M431DRAFT_344768 [Trichoderma harzianum CBS 226.95]PTB57587.1 hypothetical protein M431DRAFT_344768 [Trichoderma harzianum CBS 226.95]